jgi:hypothetical protein
LQDVTGMLAGIAAATIGDTPPVITVQPQSQTVVVGQSVTFSVTATGSPAPNYQWKFNGTNIPGTNRSYLVRNNPQLTDAGTYSVGVTNTKGGVLSDNAILTVVTTPTAPSIIAQPQSQAVSAGQAGMFSVVCGGTMPLAYQWRYNGSPVSGATLSTYSRTNAGNFSVVVTNSVGAVTSAVAVLTLVNDIIIDNADASCSFSGTWSTGSSAADKYGADYRYCSAVTGAATKTATYTPNILVPGCYDVFTWYPAGGNRTPNAPWTTYFNGGSVTMLVNQQTGGGMWQPIASSKPFLAGTSGSVQVANNALPTNVMADAVRLSYSSIQEPWIAGQPLSRMVNVVSPVTFTVYAWGGSLNYQWQFNGSNLSGASNSAYTISSAQVTNAGSYTVVVSNPAGIATTSPALLTVGSDTVALSVVDFTPGIGITLQLDGDPGNYVVLKSMDLVNWATLTNVTTLTGTAQCLDPQTTNSAQFYRAKSWP